MTLEFLHRIRKELTITVTGLRETVMVVSERVNRKVQILKLHWQASVLTQQLEALYHRVGCSIADLQPGGVALPGLAIRPEAEAGLADAAARVRMVKNEIALVEARIRELETEALRDDLLKLQHDLFLRSAAIQPVVVAAGSAAIGQAVGQLNLPASVRVGGVLRERALLVALDSVMLRAGDSVVLIGPRVDLNRLLPYFTEKQRALA